jgi:FlaA1/EpsC-like NDP-sugar epimerase
VDGTRKLVHLAEAYDVERLVLISSDKAVNPINIMGATKRVAELIVLSAARRTGRPYVSVRFGNVLDSRGSVVPTFREQIARGGPITVAHPDVSRYFMTIPEAVQLVLQAAALGARHSPGEVFVLDMGEPIKIVDLARDLIELSGREAGRGIEIVFTGLRAGDKLSEELFGAGEVHRQTRHDKIFVVHTSEAQTLKMIDEAAQFGAALDGLTRAAERGDSNEVRRLLGRLAPTYAP